MTTNRQLEADAAARHRASASRLVHPPVTAAQHQAHADYQRGQLHYGYLTRKGKRAAIDDATYHTMKVAELQRGMK